MTVKEMVIYVEVAIERITQNNKQLTKQEVLRELQYLAYHCNKKDVMIKRNYIEEKYF